MWRLGLDSLKYGLFHDLRQVRSHYNWSDLIECTGTLGKCLLQWYKSSNSQVIRDSGVVKSICNLTQHLLTQLLIFVENVSIKAVRSESLVKVRLPSCFSDVIHAKECISVDHFIDHLIIFCKFYVEITLHMFRSLIYLRKVLSYDLLNL